MNYYNEHDDFAADWLENLIEIGAIPLGTVDRRDIRDIKPGDLDGYTQCHFFAGIGGWPLALALAGYPETSRVWTGSCPCQPFSTAGRRRGESDERHLWPSFSWLIRQCAPPVVFGEQVASPAGRRWLAGVQTDLEVMGYSTGASDLCAAGVAAPHLRQRLYWVAESRSQRRERLSLHVWQREEGQDMSEAAGGRTHGRVGDTTSSRLEEGKAQGRAAECAGNGPADNGGLGDADSGPAGWLTRTLPRAQERSQGRRSQPWRVVDCVGIAGADGKVRRIKPSIEPLVNGLPGRVGRLRAYGNAIVPQVAAEFIGAYLEV